MQTTACVLFPRRSSIEETGPRRAVITPHAAIGRACELIKKSTVTMGDTVRYRAFDFTATDFATFHVSFGTTIIAALP